MPEQHTPIATARQLQFSSWQECSTSEEAAIVPEVTKAFRHQESHGNLDALEFTVNLPGLAHTAMGQSFGVGVTA